jgi:hypothetical protein
VTPAQPQSALLAALRRSVSAVSSAWADSFARRLCVDRFATASRFHLGVVVLSASATVLAVQPLSTAPMPLAWIVPAVGAAAGITWMFRS